MSFRQAYINLRLAVRRHKVLTQLAQEHPAQLKFLRGNNSQLFNDMDCVQSNLSEAEQDSIEVTESYQ